MWFWKRPLLLVPSTLLVILKKIDNISQWQRQILCTTWRMRCVWSIVSLTLLRILRRITCIVNPAKIQQPFKKLTLHWWKHLVKFSMCWVRKNPFWNYVKLFRVGSSIKRNPKVDKAKIKNPLCQQSWFSLNLKLLL